MSPSAPLPGAPDWSGVLPIDKPAGPTSFDAVQLARRTLNLRRVGHAGTLDPAAEGLLLLLLGEATKATSWLMAGRKTYRTTVRLGVTTDTYDAAGRVVTEGSTADLSPERVEAALRGFVGAILQVPPMYSALHHEGRRLHELARRGVEVERPARPVTVYALHVLADRTQGVPAEIELEVTCGQGFYVRSLAHDFGQALGCGAHLRSLRRTRIGRFDVAAAVPLAALRTVPEQARAALVPLAAALADLPAPTLAASDLAALRNGRAVPLPSGVEPPLAAGTAVRALDADGELLAVCEVVGREDAEGCWLRVVRGFRR